MGTGANYQWGTGSIVGTNPISGATSVSFTTSALSSNTTYWVYITNTTAPCTVTTSGVAQLITVKALPTVSITGSSSICVGATTTTTLSPTTGGTWSSNNASASVTNAGVVTGISAGSATFTFTETLSGCSNTTGAVTVNALPTAATLSTNNPICSGEDAVFTITGTAGDIVTYTGATGSPASPVTIGAGGTADVTVAGVTAEQTLTLVSITNGTCSQTLTQTATITVNPLPIIGSFN